MRSFRFMAQRQRYQMKPQKFYSSDPVARFLIDSLHLTPASAGLWLLVCIISQVLISFSADTVFRQSGSTALLQDWSSWISYLVFPPIVGGYYLWATNEMERLVQSIRASKVVEVSEGDIKKLLSLFQNRWRVYVSSVTGILIGLIFFLSRSAIPSWAHTSLISRTSISIGVGISTYLASMTALSLLFNAVALNRLMKDKELRLMPLHPDHCGGLRPLSEYSLKTAYLVAIAGLGIGILEYRLIVQGLFQEYWYLHLLIPLYIIAASISFFAPLGSTHVAMQEAKNKLLSDISEQFQTDYGVARKEIAGKAEELKDEIEKIQQLQTLYDLTAKFPVWPFDADTIKRFMISSATPLLPVLVGLISKIVERSVIP